MDLASIFVLILRILVPVSILRYPFFGIIASLTLDILDLPIISILGSQTGFWGGLFDYHQVDKFLDTYYLFFAFLVSLRWKETLARRTSTVLFWYRFIGVGLFSITNLHFFLFLFPNFFENFFILYLIIKKVAPSFRLEKISHLIVILVIACFPKIIQEYFLHYLRMDPINILRTFTPFYIEESTIWQWLKTKFF